ncbi:hypothetical protein [Cytobacillus gottheilii]|nr:hypothetical protein [Cytobacillus gottheilii]
MNDDKYLVALREIDTHIRSTKDPIELIVDTLLRTLPEYEVDEEDIKDWI